MPATPETELEYYMSNPRKDVYETFLADWKAEWSNRGLDDYNPSEKMEYPFTFAEVLQILSAVPEYAGSRMEPTVKDPVKETMYLQYTVAENAGLIGHMMFIALDDSFIGYTYSAKQIEGVPHNGHLTLPTRMVDVNQNVIALLGKAEMFETDPRFSAWYERHMIEVAVRIAKDQDEPVVEHEVPEQEVAKDTVDGISRRMYNDVVSAAYAIAMRDGKI